jgi:hypothetical protein
VRCLAAVAAGAVALVAAVPAGAHVLAVPAAVADGASIRIELDVPNERQSPMTVLKVELPEGLTVERAEAASGWLAQTEERRVTWSGASLEPAATARFPLHIRADRPAGQVALVATQRYADGASTPWDVTVTVLPAAGGDAPSSHLGWAVGAAAVGVVLVAGSLVALHRLRRKSLQDG